MDILKSIPQDYYINRAIGPDGFIAKLYKFYSIRCPDGKGYNCNLLKSITDNYLWHPSPLEFNDPFDCYDELINYEPTSEAIRQITTLINQNQIGEFNTDDLLAPEQIANAYRQTAINQGVCCFTKNHTSNLMWSHYAKSHTGLCLEFDHKRLFENGLNIYRVVYESAFKSLNYFDPTQDALVCKFTTKSAEWAYEQEYRSLCDSLGAVVFEKSSLTGVTFGCKASSEDILFIKQCLNDAGYLNVKWSQAQMQKDSFDLLVKPLY